MRPAPTPSTNPAFSDLVDGGYYVLIHSFDVDGIVVSNPLVFVENLSQEYITTGMLLENEENYNVWVWNDEYITQQIGESAADDLRVQIAELLGVWYEKSFEDDWKVIESFEDSDILGYITR